MIGVVGHTDVTPETYALLEPAIARVLRESATRWTQPLGGLVRVGAGLPVTFARAVRKAGRQLVLMLPTPYGVSAPVTTADQAAAEELLLLADQVRPLPSYDPRDRAAVVTADEELIRSCRQLVAVWDGSFSTREDATAHLVAYARGRGTPVEVVWPEGAARRGGPGSRNRSRHELKCGYQDEYGAGTGSTG